MPSRLSKFTKDEMLSDVYKMDHPRRGRAIVINNRVFSPEMEKQGYGVRSGTDVDCTTICKRLQALNFQVDRYHNATCAEILAAFSDAANEDHSDADCFAGVLLSHGEEDLIMGVDAKLAIKDIFEMFKANNCKSLAGKPKLFFIQACRGKELDKGVDANVADAKRSHNSAFDGDGSDVIRIPNEADFLLSYSTVAGYYSWRNSTRGSWYIQALVHVLDRKGTTTEVQKLLTDLNRLVAYSDAYMSNTKIATMHGMKQAPSFTSMLTKDLYFMPKP